jgi:hypothetical protein
MSETKEAEKLEIGVSVVVPGNAPATTWREGVIVDINAEGALLDYCHPHGIYGQGQRIPLSALKERKD